MKKIIFLCATLTAMVGLAACQKMQEDVKDDLEKEDLVTITFTAEKSDIDTRTAAVEGENSVSYKWSDDDVDNLKLYKISGSLKSLITNRTVSLNTDKTILSITITSSTKPGSLSQVYQAVLANTVESGNPCVSPTQTPTSSNFDPSADILVSDTTSVTLEKKTIGVGHNTSTYYQAEDVKLRFHRPVVVNRMTLKNLPPGKALDTVIVKSTNYKILTGSINGTTMSSGTAITLDYSSNPLTVDENGQVPVYFISLPVEDASLTVTASTTDGNTLTKSFAEGKTIDFTEGLFTRFGLAFQHVINIDPILTKTSSANVYPEVYAISYDVSGMDDVTVTATSNDELIEVNTDTAGKVLLSCYVNSQNNGKHKEIQITLSYPGAETRTVTILKAPGSYDTYQYNFVNKEWGCNLYHDEGTGQVFSELNDDLLALQWCQWENHNEDGCKATYIYDIYKGIQAICVPYNEDKYVGAKTKYSVMGLENFTVRLRRIGSDSQKASFFGWGYYISETTLGRQFMVIDQMNPASAWESVATGGVLHFETDDGDFHDYTFTIPVLNGINTSSLYPCGPLKIFISMDYSDAHSPTAGLVDGIYVSDVFFTAFGYYKID